MTSFGTTDNARECYIGPSAGMTLWESREARFNPTEPRHGVILDVQPCDATAWEGIAPWSCLFSNCAKSVPSYPRSAMSKTIVENKSQALAN